MAEVPKIDAPLTLRDQIEARAQHPLTENKNLLMHGDRRWTYRQYRDECVRMAHFLGRRLGKVDDNRPGHVAMFLENHLELLSLYGGCAYGGHTLFGINTGLRGDVLAGVVNQSRARVLVVDEKLVPELDRIRGELTSVAPENILVLPTGQGRVDAAVDLRRCLDAEVGPTGTSLDAPAVDVQPDHNLMVIYTSGTTGLPKGINNNHMKLCLIGAVVSGNIGMDSDTVGYACMPLFHSNAIFVGFMPSFWVGGAMGVRERFSASQFVSDCFRYGVTFWNYVGEPVHYVLAAIEKEYGGDIEKIRAAVTTTLVDSMLAGSDPPALRVQRALTALSVVAFEDTEAVRGVVIAPPEQVEVEVYSALVTAMRSHPLLAPVTLDDFFEQVPNEAGDLVMSQDIRFAVATQQLGGMTFDFLRGRLVVQGQSPDNETVVPGALALDEVMAEDLDCVIPSDGIGAVTIRN